MVEFEVSNWLFKEDVYRTDKLSFHTNGLGTVLVEFDQANYPHLRTADGGVFFRLCKEIEDAVCEKIHKYFPYGFHKRNEENLKWLAKKVGDLQAKKGFTLNSIIPFGGIRVDEYYFDSYIADILVDGENQQVVIAADRLRNRLIVYRKYLKRSHSKKGISLTEKIRTQSGLELSVLSHGESGLTAFTNQFVVCSCFEYDLGGKYLKEHLSIRNDKVGCDFASYLGRYVTTKITSLAS